MSAGKRLRIIFFLLAATSFIAGIVVGGNIGTGGGGVTNPSVALAIVAGLVLVLPMLLVTIGVTVTQGRRGRE